MSVCPVIEKNEYLQNATSAPTQLAVNKVHTSVVSAIKSNTERCTSLLNFGQIEYVFALGATFHGIKNNFNDSNHYVDKYTVVEFMRLTNISSISYNLK